MIFKDYIANFFYITGLNRVINFFRDFGPNILMYHAVDTVGDRFTVNKDEFQKQIFFLLNNSYNFVTLDEIYLHIIGAKKIIQKAVHISFDDGYSSIFKNAIPILWEYTLPFSIALIVENIGQDNYISLDQIREISHNGAVDFVSHTLNHNSLLTLSLDEASIEIIESKSILEDILKLRVDFFCYPGGYYNENYILLCKEAGYKGALSTYQYDSNRVGTDPFIMPRIWMTKDMTLAKLNNFLTGCYNWIGLLGKKI